MESFVYVVFALYSLSMATSSLSDRIIFCLQTGLNILMHGLSGAGNIPQDSLQMLTQRHHPFPADFQHIHAANIQFQVIPKVIYWVEILGAGSECTKASIIPILSSGC